MSSPKPDMVVGVLELLKTIPGASGWVIAIVGFSAFAWILAMWAKSSQRSFAASQASTQNLVAMSEGLRESMRKDKEACEEECRRKEQIIQDLLQQRMDLIGQHSAAREVLLQEAREREFAHREFMNRERIMLVDLEKMRITVTALTDELEKLRNQKRITDL